MSAGGFLRRVAGVFGGRQARVLAPYRARVAAINALANKAQGLSDDGLRGEFAALRQQAQNGAPAGDLLNPVFAITREAAARAVAMRHFDEQLIGGMALFDGAIAEMKTGEGKTLAATLPVCLEAIYGRGAHVVTVNDYLARRDAEWMGAIYNFLGLTVGVNLSEMSAEEKRDVYARDITYGTNNEFGFDYLRHNMRYQAQGAMRGLNYAIVDEVDSILIDEARTPLIISGEANDNIDLYAKLAKLAKNFERAENADAPGDFVVDEKTRSIQMTEAGFERAERLFAESGLMAAGDSLYDSANLKLMHHLDVALRARHLFVKDRDYVTQDGQAVIVDEFTGRLMRGRRWGDNLHQAVEAKEGLTVQKESQTLASISFQNYFRLYNKLAGMTGTALTEAEEFEFIYGLRPLAIPTHRDMIRDDELDKVYRSGKAKTDAILADIKDCRERGQPVLVGTTAIEDSEKLSALLAARELPHNVLNAKNHAQEAQIIAQAGAPGAITIATNMAGRGTDIVLGGNPQAARAAILQNEGQSDEQKQAALNAAQEKWEADHNAVKAAGGLRVIGGERHESRRIDNQLRGRSGRQGDPGSSVFYLSFEDSLLRIFATKHVSALMEKMNMPEDEPIEAKMVSRTIENAQRKVEAHNFDTRKQLLEYDDIANEQRKIVYEQREEILQAEDIAAVARQIRAQQMDALFNEHFPPDAPEEEWKPTELEKLLTNDYRLDAPVAQWVKNNPNLPREDFLRRLQETAEAAFVEKFANVDEERLRPFLRSLILNIFDDHWRAHLADLDGLRQSIVFRGMAQKNPKQEYKREAFDMFSRLLAGAQAAMARVLFALRVKQEEELPQAAPQEPTNLQYRHPAAAAASAPPPQGDDEAEVAAAAPPPLEDTRPAKPNVATIRRSSPKVRRNEACPCGSGKKYKHCCGKI